MCAGLKEPTRYGDRVTIQASEGAVPSKWLLFSHTEMESHSKNLLRAFGKCTWRGLTSRLLISKCTHLIWAAAANRHIWVWAESSAALPEVLWSFALSSSPCVHVRLHALVSSSHFERQPALCHVDKEKTCWENVTAKWSHGRQLCQMANMWARQRPARVCKECDTVAKLGAAQCCPAGGFSACFGHTKGKDCH